MKRYLLSALALWLTGLTAGAVELGMEAPPLKVREWIKGGPVHLAAGKGTNVFVLEFWATWCAPCKLSIPHLSALQKRFKNRGVVVIGLSSEEPGPVRDFLKNPKSPVMDYVVGLDQDDQTFDLFLKPFGVEGIPHAVVIDRQGRLAWQGHPLDGLDQAVEDILEDRYDIAAARRVFAAERAMTAYFEKAVTASSPTAARELGDKVVTDGASTPALMNLFAYSILTHPQIRHRDVDLAMRAARLAFEKSEGKDAAILDTYARAHLESGRIAEAITWQEKAIAAAVDPAEREQFEATLKEYRARSK